MWVKILKLLFGLLCQPPSGNVLREVLNLQKIKSKLVYFKCALDLPIFIPTAYRQNACFPCVRFKETQLNYR
jgi:hypothetical protein